MSLSKILNECLLSVDVTQFNPVKRVFYRFLQIIFSIARDLVKGHLSLQAMSLVYTTLITLVPLLALSFSVLKGFGVHNQIEPFLLGILEPMGAQGAEISHQIIGFVDNIKVGVLGAVGLGLLVYSVIALMQKIERAFNTIWYVERARSFAQRFSDYLSVLLVWPLFIFVSAGLTTSVRNYDIANNFVGAEAFQTLFSVVGVIVPYVIMALAFTFIFIFMPNKKIRFIPAFMGGLFSAFAWKLMGFIFATFVAGSSSYVAIYAAFATIIIFIIWIYLGWLVVLIGSSLAFYIQNPSYIATPRDGLSLSIQAKERIALQILGLIGRSFYSEDKKNWDVVALNKTLSVPVALLIDILKMLERLNLLAKTSEHDKSYVPACAFDEVSVWEVLTRVRQDGYSKMTLRDKALNKNIDQLFKQIDQGNKALAKQTLKDLIL